MLSMCYSKRGRKRERPLFWGNGSHQDPDAGDDGVGTKPQEWLFDGFIMFHQNRRHIREKQFLENNQQNDRALFSMLSNLRARHAHTPERQRSRRELNIGGERNIHSPLLWSQLAKQQRDQWTADNWEQREQPYPSRTSFHICYSNDTMTASSVIIT